MNGEDTLREFIAKRQQVLRYLVAFTAVGLVAYVSIMNNRSSADLALGKQVYDANCASCHGLNGEGENPSAPLVPGPDGLFPAPPHDETGHTWHHSDVLILDIIREGRIDEGFKPMPAFGVHLSKEEIKAVLAYIKMWWAPEQIEIQATISAEDTQP